MKYCAQLLSHVQLFVTLLDWVAGSSVHGILQARILGCHFLLQGIFPAQGQHPHLLQLLHCGWFLYC